jgi:hypothetical protein
MFDAFLILISILPIHPLPKNSNQLAFNQDQITENKILKTKINF